MGANSPAPNVSDLTWVEARERLRHRPIGLLPIGAIEAHGPHLPLDADVIIAQSTAHRAATRLQTNGTPSMVLPSIAYSVSFVGTSFEGTTPVDPEPFEAYLTSVLVQHALQGYRAILCCNAHLEPAHVERVVSACRSATQQSGTPVLFPDQRVEPYVNMLSDEFRAGARHAGGYETSIIMAARPDVVRMDVLSGLEPVWIDLPAKLRAGAKTFAEAGASLGYFGDPASSSVEEGHRMLDALAEIVMMALREADIDLSP